MFAITAVALVALVVFVIAMAPKFEFANLFDIEPTGAAGANSFIPFGYAGVLGALVYGIWFFLAVEGVPLAAEEANDPKRDMPRGITAMTILLVTAALMLFIAPGGAGSSAIADSDNPLPEAIRSAFGGDTWVADFVNYVGLAGRLPSPGRAISRGSFR
jgi:ethanolamine permease